MSFALRLLILLGDTLRRGLIGYLLLLVFWPSIALAIWLYSVWKFWDHSKEEFEKNYQMGKRHGKEQLAFKIYKDAFVGEDDEDEGE